MRLSVQCTHRLSVKPGQWPQAQAWPCPAPWAWLRLCMFLEPWPPLQRGPQVERAGKSCAVPTGHQRVPAPSTLAAKVAGGTVSAWGGWTRLGFKSLP